MGRDVLLLYMSPKNPNYKTQTNEGAVRYLIKEKETPDCILALCSETVRKKAMVEMPDGSTCTTLEYFRDALRRVGIPAERLVVIEVPDSMDDEKKQFQAISQLLDKIEKEDTLSIDLSGGMRDTAMLLVTAARCMRVCTPRRSRIQRTAVTSSMAVSRMPPERSMERVSPSLIFSSSCEMA